MQRAPTPIPLLVLPADVRLMQATANAVFWLAGLALGAALLVWAARWPVFAIRAIRVDGEVQRNSETTIRANAIHRLAGSFLTLDLQKARAAFEAVPWVRRAEVRRIWPMRLAVQLEEHRPVALWAAADGNDKLVNSHAEVFVPMWAMGKTTSCRAWRGPTAARRKCWPCSSGCAAHWPRCKPVRWPSSRCRPGALGGWRWTRALKLNWAGAARTRCWPAPRTLCAPCPG